MSPAPPSSCERTFARRVLENLQLATTPVEIDLANSERYYWVGFTVRFLDHSLGDRPSLAIDSRPLQDIAADAGLEHLKLSICRTASRSVDARDLPRVESNYDDPGCRVWRLTPKEPAISTTITLSGLPATGIPVLPAWVASAILLVIGLAVVLAASTPSDNPRNNGIAT